MSFGLYFSCVTFFGAAVQILRQNHVEFKKLKFPVVFEVRALKTQNSLSTAIDLPPTMTRRRRLASGKIQFTEHVHKHLHFKGIEWMQQ